MTKDKKGTRLRDFLTVTQRLSLRLMDYFVVYGNMGAIYKLNRSVLVREGVYVSCLLPFREVSTYLDSQEYKQVERGWAFHFCSQPIYHDSRYARTFMTKSYSGYSAEQKMLSMALLLTADEKYVLGHANTNEPRYMSRGDFLSKF